MTMQNATENVGLRAGFLARWWPIQMPPDTFAESEKPAVQARKCRKQSEIVPVETKESEKKLMPGVGSLRLLLMGGETMTVGQIAAALDLTMVQASRLVSKAAAAHHVRKRKAGRNVLVTIVSLGERAARRK